jgi:hypothetical protein
MTRYNPKPALLVGVAVLILGLVASYMENSYAQMCGFIALGLYSWLLLQSGARIETNEIVALKSHIETRKDIHELRDKLDGVIHWKRFMESRDVRPLDEPTVVPPVDPLVCDHDWKQSAHLTEDGWEPTGDFHCGKCGLDGHECDVCGGTGLRYRFSTGAQDACVTCGGDGVVAESEIKP